MIHLPLFGCNISLQSFLLLQFQFHSNFRRSNEKATAAAINPDSDDNTISLPGRILPKTPEQPKS